MACCLCGATMSTVACPNDTEHWLVSDHTLDALAGEERGKVWEKRVNESPAVWRCYSCEALHVFEGHSVAKVFGLVPPEKWKP